MRIVSFNIKRGFESSITQVADAIRGLEPDICLVQEVDRHVSRSGFVDQHRHLMKRCGFDKGYFFKTKSYNGFGRYGNALYFNKVSHTKPEIITLSNDASGEKRTGFITNIHTDVGQDFVLAGTHLTANRSQAEGQLHKLIDELQLRTCPESKFILGGDLNLKPHVLEKYGFRIADGEFSCGIPVRNVRFDYIVGRGLDFQAHVVHLPGISDHDPIVADLQ